MMWASAGTVARACLVRLTITPFRADAEAKDRRRPASGCSMPSSSRGRRSSRPDRGDDAALPSASLILVAAMFITGLNR
jgi:hypothetical protein